MWLGVANTASRARSFGLVLSVAVVVTKTLRIRALATSAAGAIRGLCGRMRFTRAGLDLCRISSSPAVPRLAVFGGSDRFSGSLIRS